MRDRDSLLPDTFFFVVVRVMEKKKDNEVPVEVGDDGKQERRVDVRARKSTSV